MDKTINVSRPETSLRGNKSQELNKNTRLAYLPGYREAEQGLIERNIDFLEVDFPEMAVKVYKNGTLWEEAPILTRGNPDHWGGTPAGLYKVRLMVRNGFSVSSEVYIPWTIHFYGKYYLHGEPYYTDGSPLVSEFSGGCVRLADNDAEKIYKLVDLEMPVLVIDRNRSEWDYPAIRAEEPLVSAKSFLVADLDSDFVFLEKNFKEKRQIASLTKLMTAVVAAENINLKESITIKQEMLNGYGETKILKEGERIGVVELFYPLLIESSNDAAIALSYFLGPTRYVSLMNEKAKSILMEDTVFTDVSGYDPGNESTAQDIFYLVKYILNNRPPIWQITKGEKVRSFGDVKFDISEFWNKNIFINDPAFLGGKTGFIKTSNYTGAFLFRFQTISGEERKIVIILLGSDDLRADTQKIYAWLEQNYFK